MAPSLLALPRLTHMVARCPSLTLSYTAQVRIEHWDVAMDLGRLAARNMLGKELE